MAIIDLIILIIFGFFTIYLERILEKELYKKSLFSIGIGKFFFLPFFSPRSYFKSEKLIEGYIVYSLSILSFIIALYMLIKLIGGF